MATSISPTRDRPGCTIRPGGFFDSRPTAGSICLIDTGISPNGLVLDPAEKVLFVAMTRDNAVWRMPLMTDGSVAKVGRFCSTFGASGPDGMTMDSAGRLFVAHASLGHVFVFAPNGELIARIKSCAGPSCTNVAIGGNNRDRLYITESVTGTVLVADIGLESLRRVKIDEPVRRQAARQVSVIGQGTWYIDRGDRKGAVAALRRGIDLGMTHIDTAEMYGDAELVIADAIAGRRDEVFLVSKVLAEQRLAARHHHRLRALADAAEDRPARLLSAALARFVSACGDRRRVRGTGQPPAKSVPGASAISMPTISTNCSLSPARAGSPATRCSIICRSARSSTR